MRPVKAEKKTSSQKIINKWSNEEAQSQKIINRWRNEEAQYTIRVRQTTTHFIKQLGGPNEKIKK